MPNFYSAGILQSIIYNIMTWTFIQLGVEAVPLSDLAFNHYESLLAFIDHREPS